MNITKLAGWILILMAIGYFAISLVDFGPEYAAAAAIGEKAEDYGLQTTPMNLRFKLGLELFADVLIAGVIALVGWWLTTSEVLQLIWIIGIGVLFIFSIVVRVSPVLPLGVAKVSPGALFYGAQLQVPVGQDVSAEYVVITRKQQVATVVSVTPDKKPGPMVVVDFSDSGARNQYGSAYGQKGWPVTISGTVGGTGSIAKGNTLTTVTLLRARSVYSGMPVKK